jgi:glycosyltransferase involved in cell wall biosynthesis
MGAAERLRSLARRHSADVVLVHTDREHLVAASAFRAGSRASVIRRIPAGQGLRLGRSGRSAATIAPTCYLFASENELNAAAIPRNASGRLVAQLGVEDPVAQTSQDLDGDTVDIVCIHDASSRSRAAMAIRTVAMLAPRHPRLRLLIIGEGAYDDDLRMQAAALDGLRLVHFLGERADQLEVMRGARLGWVVADSDTAAYGVLDFMSLGVPVLAGQRSIADGYLLNEITGVLLPPDDAFAAAAVAAELLTNDTRRTTMGAAARARAVREFPESAMIDGFERAAAAATSRRRR